MSVSGRIEREAVRERDSYCSVRSGEENLGRKKKEIENETRHIAEAMQDMRTSRADCVVLCASMQEGRSML